MLMEPSQTELPVVCGVPQGSILGPLLFLIYVNDMVKCVKNVSVRLYADDIVLYNADNDTTRASKVLQTDLDCYQTWCIQNKLSVNISKTKVMVFSASKRHPNTINVNLKIENQLLMVVPSYKCLGITLDNYLSFEQHINNVHKIVNYKIHQLSCLRQFVSPKMALKNL